MGSRAFSIATDIRESLKVFTIFSGGDDDNVFKDRAVPAWKVGFGLCYTTRSSWWHGPHFADVDLAGRWVSHGSAINEASDEGGRS